MRTAHPSDLEKIYRLLDLAFSPSKSESDLIFNLIKHGKELHHWVEAEKGHIIGYLAFTPAYQGKQKVGYHLAPIAVSPSHQGKGIGSRLIRTALQSAPIAGAPVFVLGDPGYYRTFGFELCKFPRCPFEPGNEHFMKMNFSSEEDFEVGYEEEFFPVR